MFWLLSDNPEKVGKAAEHAEKSGGAAHHEPIIVEFVNHWLGKPVHEFQVHYTKPLWDKFLSQFRH